MVSIGIGISPCFTPILGGRNVRDPSNFGSLIGAWYGDTGITLNGANVASWAPSYGSAAPLAQATAAAQPLANVTMPNGNKALGFSGGVLSLSLPSDISTGYFSIIVAMSARAAGWHWAVRDASNNAPVQALHLDAVSTRMFTGAGVGPVSSSASSSAVVGFSANLDGTNHKAWGSASGAVTNSTALAFSVIRNIFIGSNSAAGGGAVQNLGALWIFSGAEIDLAAACLRMAQLYPEVAP